MESGWVDLSFSCGKRRIIVIYMRIIVSYMRIVYILMRTIFILMRIIVILMRIIVILMRTIFSFMKIIISVSVMCRHKDLLGLNSNPRSCWYSYCDCSYNCCDSVYHFTIVVVITILTHYCMTGHQSHTLRLINFYYLSHQSLSVFLTFYFYFIPFSVLLTVYFIPFIHSN